MRDDGPQVTADDHELAHVIASDIAEKLLALQTNMVGDGADHWDIELEGDRLAHSWILERVRSARPDDALLSEEGTDDQSRVSRSRAWIIDPLDGSSGFGYGSPEWAVHIALSIDGKPIVGAVAAPGIGAVASTHEPPVLADSNRSQPLVVTGRTRVYSEGALLADALDAKVVACSSAGVKAALVATSRADVYVHDGPLYEWDVCAPAAMALASGLFVSDRFGEPFEFNQTRPVVEGIVVCRPELQDVVLATLAHRRNLGNLG